MEQQNHFGDQKQRAELGQNSCEPDGYTFGTGREPTVPCAAWTGTVEYTAGGLDVGCRHKMLAVPVSDISVFLLY